MKRLNLCQVLLFYLVQVVKKTDRFFGGHQICSLKKKIGINIVRVKVKEKEKKNLLFHR